MEIVDIHSMAYRTDKSYSRSQFKGANKHFLGINLNSHETWTSAAKGTTQKLSSSMPYTHKNEVNKKE